jgi:exopolyphosphatase/guanosine-5'-triphosphate,3'-diphosphate pyrophosphatase
MEEMLRSFNLKQVVISAYGLREGVLQSRLSPEERAKDPLIEFARDVNQRESRNESHASELFAWTTGVFPNETAEERRVREAICLFSDFGWRRHPDDRATGALRQVLFGAYAGANHAERAVMAAAVWFRYAGNRSLPDESGIAWLLGEENLTRARQLGLLARLAFGISGSLTGVLPHTRLQLGKDALSLEIPMAKKALAAEPVHKRLAAAADALEKRPQILFI